MIETRGSSRRDFLKRAAAGTAGIAVLPGAGLGQLATQAAPPVLRPLTSAPDEAYWREQRPIPWVRIYDLPDHAHFPHMRHVNAGVTCQECHGPVETMPTVAMVSETIDIASRAERNHTHAWLSQGFNDT